MTLIASISGVRGTIGGEKGENLTPLDVVQFCTAYSKWLKDANKQPKVVVGRDARLSGDMVNKLVCGTLMSMGIDVVDLGLSTTPTVEIAVPQLEAGGGIILTASHNPKQWNALKLLNEKGEFISGEEGALLLDLIQSGNLTYSEVNDLGQYSEQANWIEKHVELILQHPLVEAELVRSKKFSVAYDAVNSSGGIAIPILLKAMGVEEIEACFEEPNGHFSHNPEPLPQHLSELSNVIRKSGVDVGFAVDPDVDRLVIVNEDGSFFGEEYTLVAIADYVLQHKVGNTVSNLSSTGALKVVTEAAGGEYFASAVGEVNVVNMMKEKKAVIGGEGNGGIIVPELHYGRDALAGIALFLTYMAKSNLKPGQIRAKYPSYYISKKKISLETGMDVDGILSKITGKYDKYEINTTDGVKIIFDSEWVHLRKSNTEPIIRIYAESDSETTAENLALKLMEDIRSFIKE